MTSEQESQLRDLALEYGLARADFQDAQGKSPADKAWMALREFVETLERKEALENNVGESGKNILDQEKFTELFNYLLEESLSFPTEEYLQRWRIETVEDLAVPPELLQGPLSNRDTVNE